MNLYFRSTQQHKTYKITQENGNTWIYWVAVHSPEGGGFIHARGRDPVENMDTAQKLMEQLGRPVTEQDYISALKDYFAIDKKVREMFIKTYNL